MLFGKYRTRALLASLSGIAIAGGASAQLTTGLVGYYDLDGTFTNNATTVGGVGGAASLRYNGLGSSQFLVADAVPGTTSFFPATFGGLGGSGDALYLGGDTADLDHYLIPGLQLGASSFTVNVWAAMGEDQSALNSGVESTGGNGPTIFGNTATSFVDSSGPTVVGGGQGFAYGVWSSDGDDYAAYAGDGSGNGGPFGDQDVAFDSYVMHTLVYDATAQTLSRYQAGTLSDVFDTSVLTASLDNGNDLRIGGFPEGTTSGSDTFWGAIDEVSIWDRVLTSNEVGIIGANGQAGFDLEDVINGAGLIGVINDTFTGAAGANNNASNAGNWTEGTAQWGDLTNIFVATGTTAGNPAVFDTAFGSQTIDNFTFGGDGETTFIAFETGTELITTGTAQSVIGVANSDVTLTLDGTAKLNHYGPGEEASRLRIGDENSVVDITLNGSSELGAGTYLLDSTFATGFRRPTTASGIDRVGDDVLMGDQAGNNVSLEMNDSSLFFASDVLYVGDHPDMTLNVVQNGTSKTVVLWDTRWYDDGAAEGSVVTWTLNDSSEFLVARDHGLGEGGGTGEIVLNINDDALFYAGGRIALGAGFEGNVTVNQTGGTLQAGSPIGADISTLTAATNTLFGDGTGADATGIVRDGVLWMGEGSTAVYNLSGTGKAEITRTAFVGAGGGSGTVNQTGGTFTVYGKGSVGNVDGNNTIGLNISEWTDNGGDLFIARLGEDTGTYNIAGGSLIVERDIRVGFDKVGGATPEPVGGNGVLNVSGGNTTVGQVLAIGNDGNGTLITRGNAGSIVVDGLLAIGGIDTTFSGVDTPGAGTGTLRALLTGASHTAVVVNNSFSLADNVQIQSNASLEIELDVLTGVYRPTSGDSFVLIDGSAGGTGDVAGTFASLTGSDIDGIEWSVSYTGGQVIVTADEVYIDGDANGDGSVNFSDFLLLQAAFTDDGDWIDGDFTNDGVVDFSDFLILQANFNTSASSASELAAIESFTQANIPEPGSLALLSLGGLFLARRRRR